MYWVNELGFFQYKKGGGGEKIIFFFESLGKNRFALSERIPLLGRVFSKSSWVETADLVKLGREFSPK